MTKLFTYSLLAAAMGLATPAFADDVKVLSFTVGDDAKGKELLFKMSATDGAKVSVDWGDGNLVACDLADYDAAGWVFTEIKGTLLGTTVSVFAPEDKVINYLDLDWDLDDDPVAKITSVDLSALSGCKEINVSKNLLTKLDVSKCTALATLNATNNNLTALTFGDNANLSSVNVSNNYNVTTGEKNADCGDNQVLGAKWNQLPALRTLNVTGNLSSKLGWLDTFSVASNVELTTLTVNCCGLSQLDLAALTKLKTINAQWNKLTVLDASKMVANGGTVMVAHNNISVLRLPDTSSAKLTRVNVADNALTFATLPVPGITKAEANYVYTPQADVITPLSGTNTVDFSSLAKVGETASVFAWTAILDGATEPSALSEEHYEFTAENGSFRFLVPVKDLCASITNPVFPKLTLASTPATSVGLLPMLVNMKMASEAGTDFQFGFNSSIGQLIYVDWGDGVFDGPITLPKLDSAYTPDFITGKTKGSEIVVKGDASTIESLYAPAETDFSSGTAQVTTAQIAEIDLSALTAIKKLTLNYHAISSLDLSKNKELTSVNATCNKLTAFDAELPALTTLDLSNSGSNGVKTLGENAPAIALDKLPELSTLSANYTGIKPELAKAPKLKSAILQGNGYTDFAPVSASLTSITLNYNDYESFDGTGLTASGKINVFLTYNKLGAVADCMKLPASINNLNVANNDFTFATLPAVKAVGGTLTYSPQRVMNVKADKNVVDLSAQAKVGETATEFAWTLDGEASDDSYTVENGVFTFSKMGTYVATLKNAEYPRLTLTTNEIVIDELSGVEEIEEENAPVEYYNLQGVKVANPSNGIFVRRQGNKTSKVLVK